MVALNAILLVAGFFFLGRRIQGSFRHRCGSFFLHTNALVLLGSTSWSGQMRWKEGCRPTGRTVFSCKVMTKNPCSASSRTVQRRCRKLPLCCGIHGRLPRLSLFPLVGSCPSWIKWRWRNGPLAKLIPWCPELERSHQSESFAEKTSCDKAKNLAAEKAMSPGAQPQRNTNTTPKEKGDIPG